jgi:two-component system, chemotaxis family, chemotaxis protein CheY
MERRVAPRPQRVLLVDDSADLREMWKLWLTWWGFAVEEAQNGAEAVQKALARPPDLIVIDLAMPVLDGRAAIQVLASDPVTARVPILAMSAQTYALDATRGAERFLPKPADPDQLLAQIRATLRGGPSASRRES